MSYNKNKSFYSLDAHLEDDMKDNLCIEDSNYSNTDEIDDRDVNNKFRRSSKVNTERGFFYPKAVATWLFDNTALTFEQIAYVCNLHIKTVEAIADAEGSAEVIGCNPIDTGEMSRENISLCEKNQNLMPSVLSSLSKKTSKKKTYQYIPLARRRAKPDAILWLITNCPDLSYSQIMSLIGTTKNTIEAIANKSYWNMSNLRPRDPVLLKLCVQEVLQEALLKAKISIQHEEIYRKAEEAERLDEEKRFNKNKQDIDLVENQKDHLEDHLLANNADEHNDNNNDSNNANDIEDYNLTEIEDANHQKEDDRQEEDSVLDDQEDLLSETDDHRDKIDN